MLQLSLTSEEQTTLFLRVRLFYRHPIIRDEFYQSKTRIPRL